MKFMSLLACSLLGVQGLTYNDIVKKLESGYELIYHLKPADCELVSGPAISREDTSFSSTIDNWELFYDKRFGPTPYFATGREEITYNTTGAGIPYYTLDTLRVYEDELATFTIETADPTAKNWAQTSETVYSCKLSDVSFTTRDSASIKMCSLGEVKAALRKGERIRYVTDYSKCAIDSDDGMGAIGGSNLHATYDIIPEEGDDFAISWNRRTLIKNYQGEGYVYDVVLGHLDSASLVSTLTASDIATTTYEEEYIETFSCNFGCGDESAMRLYKAAL